MFHVFTVEEETHSFLKKESSALAAFEGVNYFSADVIAAMGLGKM